MTEKVLKVNLSLSCIVTLIALKWMDGHTERISVKELLNLFNFAMFRRKNAFSLKFVTC